MPYLFRHEFGNLIRKVNRILWQDAFNQECLRIKQVAVILEVLAVFTRFMQALQTLEQLMMRINLKDAFCLEHRIIHLRKSLLHRK